MYQYQPQSCIQKSDTCIEFFSFKTPVGGHEARVKCLFHAVRMAHHPAMSVSVFCQVCLQLQAEALIYLSLEFCRRGALGWVADPSFVVLSWDIQISVVLYSKQMLRLWAPLKAHSYTRWQCLSVTAGHLAECLDRESRCQQLCRYSRSVYLGWSHKDFYTVTVLPKSLSPRSLKAYAKKVTQCKEWKKKLAASQDMVGKRWCGVFFCRPLNL